MLLVSRHRSLDYNNICLNFQLFCSALLTLKPFKRIIYIQGTYQLARQYNSNDETIDSDGLTEDDRDQVLGLDPGSFDSSTHDRSASGVDPQSCSHDTERDSKADAQGCPHVWGGLRQVPSDADTLSTTS